MAISSGSSVPARIRDSMKVTIWECLQDGFTPLAEVPELAIDLYLDEYSEEQLRPQAEELVELLLDEYRAKQSSWPSVTDCDRLTAAFHELESQYAILAREHYGCCITCGTSDAWAEAKKRMGLGQQVRGYIFYHAQDTELAVAGKGLYLAFGSTGWFGRGTLAVAQDIVTVLRRNGFTPEWNGKRSQRILVPLDWKRRR